jgi:hypothetical protein
VGQSGRRTRRKVRPTNSTGARPSDAGVALLAVQYARCA